MANRCDNDLTIKGTEGEIARFLSAVRSEHLMHERHDLWISPGCISPDTGQFQIDLRFDTGWVPPIPEILEASKRFPTLEFNLEYFECEGGFFEGVYRVKDGMTLAERHGLFDPDPDSPLGWTPRKATS